MGVVIKKLQLNRLLSTRRNKSNRQDTDPNIQRRKHMNGKIIPFSNKNEEKYERCVLCKSRTQVKQDEPIEKRYGYIEGVGQLCYNCYQKVKETP